MARHAPQTDGGPDACWSCRPRVCTGRRLGRTTPVPPWSGQDTSGRMKNPRLRCRHCGSLFSDGEKPLVLGGYGGISLPERAALFTG